MTPLDNKGETTADLKSEISQIGEDLQNPDLTRQQRDALAFKVRRLQGRVERLETSHAKSSDEGITDPTIRRLTSDLRRLQNTVTKFVVEKDPDLAKVQPYMDEVLEENPEIRDIEDAERRVRLAKSLAMDKYREDHPDETTGSEDRGRDVSRAFRTGGGAPVQSRSRGSQSAQSKYEADLKAAKTADEKKAVTDRFLATHPED